MIQPQELKIGNLFHPMDRSNEIHMPITLRIIQLVEIGLFDSKYILFHEYPTQAEFKKISNRDLSPIPLTEERLLELGFLPSKVHIKNYSHPQTMNFELRNISGLEDGFKIIAGIPLENYFKAISKEIKYVHELQNIFEILTGTELTLKQYA